MGTGMGTERGRVAGEGSGEWVRLTIIDHRPTRHTERDECTVSQCVCGGGGGGGGGREGGRGRERARERDHVVKTTTTSLSNEQDSVNVPRRRRTVGTSCHPGSSAPSILTTTPRPAAPGRSACNSHSDIQRIPDQINTSENERVSPCPNLAKQAGSIQGCETTHSSFDGGGAAVASGPAGDVGASDARDAVLVKVLPDVVCAMMPSLNASSLQSNKCGAGGRRRTNPCIKPAKTSPHRARTGHG